MPPPVIHASMTFAYRGHPYQVELAQDDDGHWSALCTVDSLSIPIGDNSADSAAEALNKANAAAQQFINSLATQVHSPNRLH